MNLSSKTQINYDELLRIGLCEMTFWKLFSATNKCISKEFDGVTVALFSFLFNNMKPNLT